MASRTLKVIDQETQVKDIRRQLSDQLACLDFRMESKLSLLNEFQEFFKRRGEVEYEYARSLERLCERFEKNTKQRNIRNEVRSTFNLWSTLLAETRKMSRERAWVAESLAAEMVARLDVMAKDVQVLTKKCKELCVEIQDQFLKELRDLSEQTKVYQHSCHNASEAYSKVCKSKEKLDAIKGTPARRKKADEKYKERQKQHKVQKHLLLKNRNDYLLGIARCNALSTHYFSMDIMDVIEHMDLDYHASFQRLSMAYRDCEREACEALLQSGEMLVEQSKSLNLENDLHYFMSEYSIPFSAPNYFQFTQFEGDDVHTFKVNTEDIFKRWSKTMADLKEEIQTLEIQREEDVKTIQHIKQVNLKKYQITSVDDAFAIIEDNGDTIPLESSRDRGTASLERGLSLSTRAGQAIILSQKGKKDTVNFTLQIMQRRILRADRLAVATAQLEILDKAFDEQKVPPVPVGVDAHGRAIPGEVPQLFGGDLVQYIMATGSEIPLIVQSCVKSIETHGIKMEGLFRVPGPAAMLEELRTGFEEGRDPLCGSSHNKLDVAAVASTLKAYFRELSTPLFPTAMYHDFINCSRQEDSQSRLDALSSTIKLLPLQIIPVMRFLFWFLYRVSLHATDNKMGSPNLALVFGPTLTRAPDSLDPRQLHNDVPSVNMLIQMCIDGHEFIFGEEEQETPESCAPDTSEVPQNLPLSTSPPTEPPSAPPITTPPAPSTSDNLLVEDELPPPPPRPPRVSDDVPVDSFPPPRPPKPETMSPPPPPPPPLLEECEVPQYEVAVVSSKSSSPPPPLLQPPQASSREGSRGLESSTTSQGSGLDMSSLDATMQEIEESLQEMGGKEPVGDSDLATTLTPVPEDGDEVAPVEVDDEDEEDDSDSEDESDALRIGARALYDYEARSDKELSFSQGDSLQVITKTPDNNWWDGFHCGKRGFIPVAYVEITELKTSPAPPPPQQEPAPPTATLAVPAPPQRKSSIPVTDVETTSRVSEIPNEPSILEEVGNVVDPEPFVAEEALSPEPKSPPANIGALQVDDVLSKEEMELESGGEDEVKADAASSDQGSNKASVVKSLTKQFQEPEATTAPPPKVLVEPLQSHRRQHSDHYPKPATETQEPSPSSTAAYTPRSSSGGSKVSMLSSTFENKVAAVSVAPPPFIKPKPHDVFPLVQHGSGSLPGVSPLQRAAHQSQQVGQKPAVAIKKPAPPASIKAPGKVTKSSIRVKKKDSLKEKEKPAKPATTPKPGFVASSAEINAVLQARAKRKQSEDMIK